MRSPGNRRARAARSDLEGVVAVGVQVVQDNLGFCTEQGGEVSTGFVVCRGKMRRDTDGGSHIAVEFGHYQTKHDEGSEHAQ